MGTIYSKWMGYGEGQVWFYTPGTPEDYSAPQVREEDLSVSERMAIDLAYQKKIDYENDRKRS